MNGLDIETLILQDQDIEAILRRSMEIIIQLYTNNAHFIYELLQNAEDAGATQIKFLQFDDRLEVYHDGRPFSLSNLHALHDVAKSDKKGDLNKIGKFGVGFKSVYSICEIVRLYSTPAHYRGEADDALPPFAEEIHNFIKPRNIPLEELNYPYTTKFVFPYAVGCDFTGFTSKDALKKKISSTLQNLGITTLLFMKHLEGIFYEINIDIYSYQGSYSLDKKEINDHCLLVSALGHNSSVNKGKDIKISYLKFSRLVDTDSTRTVDIAFPVIQKGENDFECKKPRSPYISVYFPTETKSELDFIVQGPYRTTPNRSNIPADNDDNKKLADKTAILLIDTLNELRDKGWLNMSFIKALPLSAEAFESYNLFHPLYEAVREHFSNPAIDSIPTKSGGYVSARFAKIVRNEKLLEIFDDDLLTELIRQGVRYQWLPSCLTETNKEYMHVYKYFVNELKIAVIRPENLRNLLEDNPYFLRNRSDSWLVQFYKILENVHSVFDKKSKEPNYLTTVIVKTANGDFIAPYRRTENNQFVPNVYLPSKEISVLDVLCVDEDIYSQCESFFVDVLRLEKPKEYDFFISDVKRRYNEDYVFDEDRHIDDIKKLIKFSGNSNYKEDVENVIKEIFLIRCTDGKMRNPHTPGILVFLPKYQSIDIAGYLKHIAPPNVYFVDLELYTRHQIEESVFGEFGVINSLLVGDDITSGELKSEKRGRNPMWHTSVLFRWKLTMRHLSDALKYIAKNPSKPNSVVKSQAIFSVLSQNEEKLRGTVYDRNDNVLMEGECCDLLKTLRGEESSNFRWVYDESDKLVAPKEITKDEISKKYYGELGIRAVVYELLGFKKSSDDVVRDLKLKIPSEQLEEYFEAEIRKRYKMSSTALAERLKSFAVADMGQVERTTLEFPTARVKNWDALRRHVHEVMRYGAPVVFERVERRIRVSGASETARNYLKSQYRYDNYPQFACQMCHKASPDIEACQLFKNPEMELAQLHLSLCLHCAKRYRSLRDLSQGAVMRQFKKLIRNLSQHDIDGANPVCLKLQNYDIWFTQTHIAEIRELLRLERASKD